MKTSRLSPRYEVELIELADEIDAAVKAAEPGDLDDAFTLSKLLSRVAKDLRLMVDDNERFLNS